MILHVTFSDGSNPWVFYGDRQQVAKHWRRWMKYHPETAQPVASVGKCTCFPALYNLGYYVRITGRDESHLRFYNHLGHALRALERLGGEQH